MRQTFVQYDPANEGVISAAVTSDEAPIVADPLLQIAFPEGTNTLGMMLDLSGEPPVLISAPVINPGDQ